jgi:hypothetical protein
MLFSETSISFIVLLCRLIINNGAYIKSIATKNKVNGIPIA